MCWGISSKKNIDPTLSQENCKQAYADKDLIFIDTPGRPGKEKNMAELKSLLDMAQPTETHLVLPANINNLDMLDTVRKYSDLNVNRIIVSKVDETSAKGVLLNIAYESSCPISYITTGQSIPEDIELANSTKIAKMILGMK